MTNFEFLKQEIADMSIENFADAFRSHVEKTFGENSFCNNFYEDCTDDCVECVIKFLGKKKEVCKMNLKDEILKILNKNYKEKEIIANEILELINGKATFVISSDK